jgi:hypothetical protein
MIDKKIFFLFRHWDNIREYALAYERQDCRSIRHYLHNVSNAACRFLIVYYLHNYYPEHDAFFSSRQRIRQGTSR